MLNAVRSSRISVSNFVLLVFLALKNTPLAPLSGHSYEKLRPLHKTAGYTCILTTFFHASIYLSSFGISGDLENMRQTKNLAGVIAGLAMVILGFSTIAWLTQNYYECEYRANIGLFKSITYLSSVLCHSHCHVSPHYHHGRNASTRFQQFNHEYHNIHGMYVVC